MNKTIGNMKYKPRTIIQVVVLTSAISSVIAIVAAIINGTPWWGWVLSGSVTFLITFYLLNFFLNDYMIRRIKPLYQLLLSRDIITSRLSKELRNRVDDNVIQTSQESIRHLEPFSSDEVERMVQREQERSEFLAGIAHEIDAPVRYIQSYSENLLDGNLDNPVVVKEYIERILRCARQLVEQVDDINKLIHYESGGAVMYKENFDIIALIHEVFDTNILRAYEQNVKFKIDRGSFSAHAVIVGYGDAYRLGVVLNNLILNAIQYNKPGGFVTVGLVDLFDKVLVEVSDTGEGISPEDLRRIFERSFRAGRDRPRRAEGSGLGLAVVKLIVDSHSENITVRSELGRGTTVSFTVTKGKKEKKAKAIPPPDDTPGQ